jgi:NADH-quinone oxidoreductase subunit G
VVEKDGAFLDWEGRVRPFAATLVESAAMPDLRAVDALAAHMGHPLGLPHPDAARAELSRLGPYAGPRPAPPSEPVAGVPDPGPGEAVLAAWHLLLDDGRLQDGEPFLAGTRRPPVAMLSEATAAELDLSPGAALAVTGPAGQIELPLAIADLPDRVVWLPMHSPGSHVPEMLGAPPGAVVRIGRAGS